jgi:hypothetical protein
MPSTTQLVDIMEMSAPGWNREGEKGLIEILDSAQNILSLQESAQTQAYRSDGELPYIATTKGTYSYTLNQATTGLSVDIWRVASVLVTGPFSSQLLDALQFDYDLKPNIQQPIEKTMYNGEEYFQFHQVTVKDAKRGSYPILKFTINPNTTTNDFKLLCYEKPTSITSEAIQPTIPENFHYNTLLPTAMKLLEAYQTNNWIEAMQMINEEYKPLFVEGMNESEQGEVHSVTRYEE